MSGEKPRDPAPANPALAPGDFAPGGLGELLMRIEAEPVPERLLQLALELQKALAERRLGADAARFAPTKRASSTLVG